MLLTSEYSHVLEFSLPRELLGLPSFFIEIITISMKPSHVSTQALLVTLPMFFCQM
jgi:hypothetical protein